MFMQVAGRFWLVRRMGAGCWGWLGYYWLWLGWLLWVRWAASSVYAGYRAFLACKAHGSWLLGLA